MTGRGAASWNARSCDATVCSRSCAARRRRKTAADIVVALRRYAEEGDYNYSLAVKDLNALEAAELARFVGHPRRWCATSQQAMTAADAAAWS